MRLNQFLKIEPPSEHKLVEMDQRMKRFQEVFTMPTYQMPAPFESEDIRILTQTLQGSINLKPFERGIAALITILEREVQKQKDLSVPYEAPGVEHEMSAFTKIFMTPLVLRMIGEENQDLFSLPLIRRGSTLEEMKHIERLSGKSEQEALKIASSTITDIENATRFPPEIQFEYDRDEMLNDINDIIKMFGGAPLDIEALKAGAVASSEGEGLGGYDFGGMPELPEFPELPELTDIEDFEEEEDAYELPDSLFEFPPEEEEDGDSGGGTIGGGGIGDAGGISGSGLDDSWLFGTGEEGGPHSEEQGEVKALEHEELHGESKEGGTGGEHDLLKEHEDLHAQLMKELGLHEEHEEHEVHEEHEEHEEPEIHEIHDAHEVQEEHKEDEKPEEHGLEETKIETPKSEEDKKEDKE